MTSAEIRQSFLDFFREKKHTIVASSSLLPDAPNLLFTNAGMNQFVPIFLGQEKPTFDPPRAADTQKCIRAGGKHNDLDDVGLDTYHHTFFEMLGNWSFGDYFKKEAIEWAWELVVRRWKLPPERLYATVYQPRPNEPSEFDQEAHHHWARLFTAVGLDPAVHIVNGNKKDNFWMMGDTGPCGPCSELHVDLTPLGDTRGALVNAGDARCIEIWNLVFIQFNANPDGTFSPLPQRHVDTGMGFERVTAIIQGTNKLTNFTGTISNYETDVFRPIFDEIEKLSGKRYGSTLPNGRYASSMSRPAGFQPADSSDRQDARRPSQAGSLTSGEQQRVDVAFRVIADHIRSLSFAIADGIQPNNEGRGYVLRRILRRAVRYGRSLGFHEPFFYRLVDALTLTMGEIFPELREKRAQIEETLKREEESFNHTLDIGINVFEQGLARWEFDAIPGDFAFLLYDTYGFPLDLTELMARERGLTVDRGGFEKLMEEQRARARKAQKKEEITISSAVPWAPTKFVGFEKLVSAEGHFVIQDDCLLLEVSPFYAEMGGQVGDTGRIITMKGGRVIVANTTRTPNGVYALRIADSTPLWTTDDVPIRYEVDQPRRAAIERHHTVTHLLHWALHEVVSRDATQKGSYVGPEKLTFDFSSVALTKQQVREVEKLVNEKIAESASVSWTEIPYVEAKQRADIMQFFGDKYGDVVRVVQIGGTPNELNGYSMELCGGTHVRATGDIRRFKIVSESAIAAGIRRIEAVAGDEVFTWAESEAARQQEKFEILSKKKPGIAELPSFATSDDAGTAVQAIEARASHLKQLDREVHEWEKQHAKAAEADLRSRAAEIAGELAASHSEAKGCVSEIPNADGALLQAVADILKTKIGGPIVLAGSSDGRVDLVAVVPKDWSATVRANEIIQAIAPIVDGKGGGRPDNARGAGKDSSKIGEALAHARTLIAS
jgi:alanyl-tRNA synthetase